VFKNAARIPIVQECRKSDTTARFFDFCHLFHLFNKVRDLEEGTKRLHAHVSSDDIIHAELRMLDGVDSDLMCFHPYKTVLAYTDDLRTYLRSKAGASAIRRNLSVSESGSNAAVPIVSGEMLRPIHDDAWKIVDDACVSDIPLLYTPGQIGLAAMILANEELEKKRAEEAAQEESAAVDNEDAASREEGGDPPKTRQSIPSIDLQIYVKNRFKGRSEKEHKILEQQMQDLTEEVKQLKSGKFGCGNHGLDLGKLKEINKKLKKCKAWGVQELPSKEKKKKKKRKFDDSNGPEDSVAEPPSTKTHENE
jgi:cyclin H